LALFEVYAETDEPNIIGPEGFEKLCGDASLSMEGPVPLILAWQMNAKEMAKISKEEWVSGMKDLRYDRSIVCLASACLSCFATTGYHHSSTLLCH